MTVGNVLLDQLVHFAETRPDATAVIDGGTGERLTFRDLLSTSFAAADWLVANGGEPNSNLILTVPLGIGFLQLSFGAFINGMVPALVDPGSSKEALLQSSKELRATIWATNSRAAAVGDQPVGIPPAAFADEGTANSARLVLSDGKCSSDPILILYTSGTTGLPKGVPWTGRELRSQIELYSRDDIDSEFCLFAHLALVAVAMGRTAVLPAVDTLQPQQIDVARVSKQMAEHGSDYVFASPLFWDRLVQHLSTDAPAPRPTILIAATAGSAVSGRLVERLEKALPETQIRIPYASTEALMPITSISSTDYIHLSRTKTYSGHGIPLGRNCDSTHIAILSPDVDVHEFVVKDRALPDGVVGEIVASGSRVTHNYFRRPGIEVHAKLRDVLTERVWHRTGDMGYKDESGRLWFVCRKKDILITPYGTIYPDLLEQMWNMSSGAVLSAVVFSERIGSFLYVLPPDSTAVVDRGVLNMQAERIGIPDPVVVILDRPLPADRRHNSKIDRIATLELANSRLSSMPSEALL